MRTSLLVTVLPLVGAMPRSPPGERDTKTVVSERSWPSFDERNSVWGRPGWKWSDWKWPDWHGQDWHWPRPGSDKPGNGKPGNDQPGSDGGDDSCDPDDNTPPSPPQDPTPTKPVPTPEVPPVSPAPTATQAPPGGNGPDYMKIVNKWMDACGLRQLQYDPKLESNALKASQESDGQLKHKMFPGTMAQVMAQGDLSSFERALVGGWLCETSWRFKDRSVCSGDLGRGWNHMGQTGHADILSDARYTKIGCQADQNILTCDCA
ncbi:hypothetical protein J3459_016287 [Metarhizium acridum]|nr:hypothetical protein J3459_016287 [Metarhizium acridum]